MIRVFVIEKAPLTCVLIAAALQNEPEIEVTGFAPDISSAAANALPGNDVIVVNTTLSTDLAIEQIQFLAENFPQTKVLAVGLPESPEVINACLQAGALSYVLDQEPPEALARHIQALSGHDPGQGPLRSPSSSLHATIPHSKDGKEEENEAEGLLSPYRR